MIPWQKYDPENPPELNITFLVTNGKRVISAWLDRDDYTDNLQWWEEDQVYLFTGVTHYASINLPGEE